MARPKSLKPAHIHHKASGRGCVKLNGEWKYTGAWGTREAADAYDRLIYEWVSRERRPEVDPGPGPAACTVTMLLVAYWDHAAEKYRVPVPTPAGEPQRFKPSGELENIRMAIREARRIYGATPAAEFGPKKLKALRAGMIAADQCRNYINRNVRRIVAAFTWAASEELVPASVPAALDTVAGLRKGEGGARESDRVVPVHQDDVDKVLVKLPEPVQAIVQLQLLTGARQGELLPLRMCDVLRVRPGGKALDPWEYRPGAHKTAHHGHERLILFGSKSQEVLNGFLHTNLQAPCFTPPGRVGPYTSHSYRRAIARACEVAFGMPKELRRAAPKPKVPTTEAMEEWTRVEMARRTAAKAWRRAHVWTPHRLRHSAATRFRREHGMEMTQVLLGHQLGSRVTETYAEADRDKARDAIRTTG